MIGAGRSLVALTTAIVACVILLQCPASAEKVYVDPTNAGDPAMDGSPAHPFDTIQRGIDNASASDAVIVANGTYDEAVVVSTAIILRGNGSATVDPGPTMTGIAISENGVFVRDMDVTNARYGIDIDGSGVTVEDCTIDDCQRGVRIQDQSMSGTVLSNLTVSGCQHGIWMAQSSYVEIDGVNASDNQFNGIYLYLVSDSIIGGVTALNNGERGIYLENSADNTIRSAHVSGNEDGIYLDSSSDENRISDSTVTGNRENVFSRNSDGLIVTRTDLGEGIERNLHLSNSVDNEMIDSNALPGDVTLEFQSVLRTTNGTIWDETVEEDSLLVVRNWIDVRVATAPPSSFGIVDADVLAVEHGGTSNRTVYATSHFGGDNATTDAAGWSARVLVLTRKVSGADVEKFDHTLDVHYYGWTNSTIDARIVMNGIVSDPGTLTTINVNGTTRAFFRYPLVVYYSDVTISGVEVWDSLSVIIFGNLTVENGGNLSVISTHLWIASNTTVNYIQVVNGGTLVIADGDGDADTLNDASVIAPLGNGTFAGIPEDAEPGLLFWAWSGSDLRVSNSLLAGMGTYEGSTLTDLGLYVATQSFSLADVNLSQSRHGIVLDGLTGVSISGLTFHADDTGVSAYDCTDVSIADVRFVGCERGIFVSGGTGLSVADADFDSCVSGAVVSEGSVALTGLTFVDGQIGLNVTGTGPIDVDGLFIEDVATGVALDCDGNDNMIASIANLSVMSAAVGLAAEGSVDLTLESGGFIDCSEGILLVDLAKRFDVIGATIEGPQDGTGIRVIRSRGNLIDITLTGVMTGIAMDNATVMNLKGISISGAFKGIDMINSLYVSIDGADIDLDGVLGATGIAAREPHALSIFNLSVRDCAVAISLVNGTVADIGSVDLVECDIGIEAEDVNGLTVLSSRLTDCPKGISASGINARLEGVQVTGGETGISLSGSDSRAIGCTVNDTEDAVVLSGKGHRAISNVLSGGARGIVLDGMDDGAVDGNSLDGFEKGIVMIRSYGNSVGSNDILKDDDAYGFALSEDGAYNDIGRNNTVDGERLRYYYAHEWETSVSAVTISVTRLTDIGQIVFVNCTDTLSLQEANITGGVVGLAIIGSDGVHVSTSDFVDNAAGIMIDSSLDVDLQYVSVWGSERGIVVLDSRRITIGTNGTISRCDEGVFAQGCVALSMIGDIVFRDNDIGLKGIDLEGLLCDGTTTMRPRFEGNRIGMTLSGSEEPEIYDCDVEGSSVGIRLEWCNSTAVASVRASHCDVGLEIVNCSDLTTSPAEPLLLEDCGSGLSLIDSTGIRLEGLAAFRCSVAVRIEGGDATAVIGAGIHGGGEGIRASDMSDILIEDTFLNGTGVGICLVGVSDGTVTLSNASGGETFLIASGSQDVQVLDNLVLDSSAGVEISTSDHITIRSNSLAVIATDENGGPLSGSVGIQVSDSDWITILENAIFSYRQGILVAASYNVTVTDVSINGSTYRAISAATSSISITAARLHGNAVGIFGSEATIAATDVTISTGDRGIEMAGGTLSATDVTLTGMADAGASLSSCTADLEEIMISTSSNGIKATEGCGLTLSLSSIYDNDVGLRVIDAVVSAVDVALTANRVGIHQDGGTVSIGSSAMLSLQREALVEGGTLMLQNVNVEGRQECIVADISEIDLIGCTIIGPEVGVSATDSGVVVSSCDLECDDIAIEVVDSELMVEGSTVTGTAAGIVAESSDLDIERTTVADSGTGLEVSRCTVRLIDPTFEGNGNGIKAIHSAFGEVDGLVIGNCTLDFWMAHCGLVSATNTTFSTYSFTNTSLAIENYLRIRVVSQSTGFGMEDADILVWDDSGTIYATPYFNGTDPRTDRDGHSPYILVGVLNYAPSGVTKTSTAVSVRRAEWRVMDLAVDMSQSHTETYRFPYVTFQTISYGAEGAEAAGDGQKGLVGTVAKVPLRVYVEDEKNHTVQDIAVVFEVLQDGLDVVLDPGQGFSGPDGYILCNVTLPSTAANFTVLAYLKLDPWKNITFDLRAIPMEVGIEVNPSRSVIGGERVEIIVRSTPASNAIRIDFGDGSTTGWTDETHHYHSYAPSSNEYIVTAWVRTATGLVSAPVTTRINVTAQEDVDIRRGEESEGTQWPAVAAIVVVVAVMVMIGVTFAVPGIWKKVMPFARKRPVKEVEFVQTPEAAPSGEEIPEGAPEEEKAPAKKAPAAESLEDLILDLERHKPAGEDRKKRTAKRAVRMKGGRK